MTNVLTLLDDARRLIQASRLSDVENLQPDTPVQVFHGSDLEHVVTMVRNGIDGRKRVNRQYPHWQAQGNKPGGKRLMVNRGLFVAPDLGTALKFGRVAIRFVALGKDLFPIYPSPEKIRAENKIWSKTYPNSFRPSVTAYLTGAAWGTEPQALFRGRTSPRAISMVYLTVDQYGDNLPRIEAAGVPYRRGQSRAGGNTKSKVSYHYVALKPKDFLAAFKDEMRGRDAIAEPQERIGLADYFARLEKAHGIDRETIVDAMRLWLERAQSREDQIRVVRQPSGSPIPAITHDQARRLLKPMLAELGLELLPVDPREHKPVEWFG